MPSFPVRRSRFQVTPSLARHYVVGRSPLIAHLLTALSATFPAGERFFIDSMRSVRDQVTDEQLQEQISAFIGQEAMHSQTHAQLNKALNAADYNLEAFHQYIINSTNSLRACSLRRQLGTTVAFEHFTAMISGYLLEHSALLQGLDENMQQLWLWHAVEEIEHKNVAFDVYQYVFAAKDEQGSLAQRRRSMRSASRSFSLGWATMTLSLLWQDRQQSFSSSKQVKLLLADAAEIALMMMRLLPEYLAFYKADFHPSQCSHQELLAEWKEKLGLV